MSSFTTPLRIERLDGGRRRFVVLEQFIYEVGELGSGRSITVPTGFETDFASIPRGLWNLFPPVGGAYDKAAVLHDYLYRGGCITEPPEINIDPLGVVTEIDHHTDVTRGEADGIFKEAMAVLGVGRFTRYTIYTAVRIGGGSSWRVR